jgi:hypothetical protein
MEVDMCHLIGKVLMEVKKVVLLDLVIGTSQITAVEVIKDQVLFETSNTLHQIVVTTPINHLVLSLIIVVVWALIMLNSAIPPVIQDTLIILLLFAIGSSLQEHAPMAPTNHLVLKLVHKIDSTLQVVESVILVALACTEVVLLRMVEILAVV